MDFFFSFSKWSSKDFFFLKISSKIYKLKFIFQGDSALFGINGFNLLVDGGFSRKACFWDFSRHLDRLDAILITRISDDNAGGMSALLKRKTMSAVYPQIGKPR